MAEIDRITVIQRPLPAGIEEYRRQLQEELAKAFVMPLWMLHEPSQIAAHQRRAYQATAAIRKELVRIELEFRVNTLLIATEPDSLPS